MEVAIFFVLMLGLLIFILWDGRQPVAPPQRAQMEKGWKPRDFSAGWICAAMSLVSAGFGLQKWIEPENPPFHGRGAVLQRLFYEILGPRGPAVMLWVMALILAVSAIGIWRIQRAKQRTPS